MAIRRVEHGGDALRRPPWTFRRMLALWPVNLTQINVFGGQIGQNLMQYMTYPGISHK